MARTLSSSSSSDVTAFRDILSKARNVLVLTGAGVSAESGVPTFRGEGGLWRTFRAQDLATLDAFYTDPGLVWEFYHYRREVVRTKQPNNGHLALAAAEKVFQQARRSFTVVTQNIDGLHQLAGSQNVVELHGNLFKTRCLSCSDVRENYDSPICNALAGRGAPEFDPEAHTRIKEEHLPHCQATSRTGSGKICGELLRPHIVWFGEALERDILRRVDIAMAGADLCLVVGTSALVYPAAGFATTLASRGVPVAEVNLESTPASHLFKFVFNGKSGDILPQLFNSLSLT